MYEQISIFLGWLDDSGKILFFSILCGGPGFWHWHTSVLQGISCIEWFPLELCFASGLFITSQPCRSWEEREHTESVCLHLRMAGWWVSPGLSTVLRAIKSNYRLPEEQISYWAWTLLSWYVGFFYSVLIINRGQQKAHWTRSPSLEGTHRPVAQAPASSHAMLCFWVQSRFLGGKRPLNSVGCRLSPVNRWPHRVFLPCWTSFGGDARGIVQHRNKQPPADPCFCLCLAPAPDSWSVLDCTQWDCPSSFSRKAGCLFLRLKSCIHISYYLNWELLSLF